MNPRFLCFFTSVSLVAASAVANPQIALDEEFPQLSGATSFSGEITLVEHINRRGLLRLDRDGTINKYFWDLPHEFQMLPYGAIHFHGATGDLKDIPPGTHLHGKFFLGPEGDYEVKPPVSGYVAGKMARPDLRSVESKYSRVFLLEDDFSFYQRQGLAWRINSIRKDQKEVRAELVSLETGNPADIENDPFEGEQRFRIDQRTRFWQGNRFASIADLKPEAVVQVNLTWVTLLGPQKQHGIVTDIWLDEESQSLAAKVQQGRHNAQLRLRGVGAKVMKTEHTPGKGAEGHVTMQFHAGIDPELIEEIVEGKTIFVRAAEPSLRTYDSNDQKAGHIKEVIQLENPPPGSSGVQIRFHIYEMFEGLRAGRTIKVGRRDWEIPFTPREEKLWPQDIRKFTVGPKHIADRDGPPPSVTKAE